MRYLLPNDLAELVHIFKENVVVRHSPNPSGLKKKKKNPQNICRPGADGPVQKVVVGGKRRSRTPHFSTENDRQATTRGVSGRDGAERVSKKGFFEFQLLPPSWTPRLPLRKRAAQLRVNRHRRGSIIQFGSPPVQPRLPLCFPVSSSRVKKAADHTWLSINTRAKLRRLGVCSCSRSRAESWD